MEADETPIQGPRVRLRRWLRRDTLAQELWPRYSEPFNSLWNIPRTVFFDDDSRAGFSSQRYAWAVEDGAGRLIGRISLREIDQRGASARLGISLAQPYVGQGLGTEALALFLDKLYFGPMGFTVMRLDVAAVNQRAVRSYEKLGFEYVESEWRSAGNDPSARLVDDPRYAGLAHHFRRGRFETLVEFYEMELTRERWATHSRNT